MPKIKIDINLYKKQAEMYNALRRFNHLRCGRRFGKTRLAISWLAKRAITIKGLHWFLSPDLATCREVCDPLIRELFPPELIINHNKQDRTYNLFNGSMIVLKTIESWDALRGRGLVTIVGEEAALWPHGDELWHKIIRPQLADKLGHAMLISSPNGSNWFRRIEETHKNDPEWFFGRGTIYDNPFIQKSEIEALKAHTPNDIWQQEYLGEYVESIGTVLWTFNTQEAVSVMDPTGYPMVRGADWGLADATAFVWVAILPDKRAYVWREHVATNTDIPTHARAIAAITGNRPILYTVMDSSAWRRDSDMSNVPNRFAKHGIRMAQATRDFDGSVSDLQSLMSDNRIIIDPSCTNLLKGIRDWQHGQHEPDAVAALRYAIASLVRNGKLSPPMKPAKPKTFQEHLEERRQMVVKPAPLGQRGLSLKIYNI